MNPPLEFPVPQVPRTPSPRRSLVALLTLSFGFVAVPAIAETKSPDSSEAGATQVDEAALREAGLRFNKGLSFYGSGDYQLALIEFERAYSLSPDYRVLYNIGQVSIQLGKFARARAALTAYLEKGGPQIDAGRTGEVKADLAMLMDRTALLTVVSSEDGATVFVDAVEVGVTPLSEPLLLDAGEHVVSAKKRGFLSRDRRLTLAGAETFEIALELEREVVEVRPIAEPTAPVVSPVSPQPVDTPQLRMEPAPAWPRVAAWSVFGVVGVGAISTGVLGAVKLGSLSASKSDPSSNSAEREALAAEAENWLIATDVLTGVAVLGLATASYFQWFAPASRSTLGPVAFGPRVLVAPAGVTFSAQF